MEPTYISAFPGIGLNRMFVGNDGNIYEASGGSRAWRNNNPGNLEYGSFARDNGAIGTDGRFAIFPDTTTGFNAMADLLSTSSYQKLTIEGVINRYAPPSENNVENYLKAIERQTGFTCSTPMNQLSKDNLLNLAKAMSRHEGNIAGKKRFVSKNEKYIWVTVGDDKVRPKHKRLDGTIRTWYDFPRPGEEYGCRCHAESVN